MGSVTDDWYLSGELHIESESSDRPDKDAWQDHFGHSNIWGKFTKIATVRMWGLQNCYGLLQNWDTDSLFIGLKDEGSNRKDAVIAFGDDADESLRFLFAGAGFPPSPPKELLRITGSGNVGIGTMNPFYPLDVNGALRANRYYGLNSLSLNDYQTVNPASNVYLYSSINDRDSWIFLDSADTGSNWGIYHRQIDSPIKQLPANSIGFIGGGNSDLKAYICLGDGSAYFKGNIGIGTTNPTHPLHVKTDWGFLALDSNAAGQDSGVRLMEGGAVKWHMWNSARDAKFYLARDGLPPSLAIDKNSKLTVVGDMEIYGIVDVKGNYLKVRGAGDEQLYIGGDAVGGDVQIGSENAAITHVSAWSNVNGWMDFHCKKLREHSDIRNKENIEAIDNALEKIVKLRGVMFHWKNSELKKSNFTKRKEIGLMAQEVDKVIPEAVSLDRRGYFSISYSSVIPVLIEAIKEIKIELDKLISVSLEK